MEFLDYNKKCWEAESSSGTSAWSKIVPEEVIKQIRQGKYEFGMGPSKKALPKDWLRGLKGAELLCLGGGGGQQAPMLAAFGANVTVFDFSEHQLILDKEAGSKYQLNLITVQGDMRDLSVFLEGTFDFIVNPASTMFVDDLSAVWKECYRVLRQSGKLISTTMNPLAFAFDRDQLDVNEFPILKYSVPYSDLESLPKDELEKKIKKEHALEFGHTLEQIIGGQITAGFNLVGFQESYWGDEFNIKADRKFPQYLHTCALKV